MTNKRSGSYARVDPTAPVVSRGSAVLARADAEYAGVTALERLEIELLLDAIFRHYGHDFRSYAFSSLRRRFRKRLEAEGVETFSALQDRVLHDPAAMERLLRDMSVNVTGMFRDPSFFLALRQQVVPILRTYPFVRIWHAGCATGEEVYALAMMLEEEGLYERARIYATDMNSDALDKAKAGIFPLARMREYTSNYLQAGGTRSFSEYYTANYEAALFDARLRRNVLFAQHNLATDTSFSEFNLILCRNVLIYFDRKLKERVYKLFADSLASLGIVCLGRRESMRFTSAETEYEEFDAKERIYRRRR
jgi:chemotaxis protein methyltransferase CheR